MRCRHVRAAQPAGAVRGGRCFAALTMMCCLRLIWRPCERRRAWQVGCAQTAALQGKESA
jgi:hypothetical protein